MLLLLVCSFNIYSFNICNAQGNIAVLPDENCTQGESALQDFIQNFQNAPPPTPPNLYRPNSYVINTTDIISYFNDFNSDYDCYFHVYFAVDPNNIIKLVIVPTVDYVGDGNYIMQHDLNYQYAFVPCLYQRSDMVISPQQFCYTPDQLDAISNNNPPPTPCFYLDVINPTPATLPIPSSTVLKNSVSAWVLSYQNYFSNDLSDDYIQSFTFNANLLRSFLTQSGNTIPLLQIYIGVNPIQGLNNMLENYTLIFIGLDNLGNHIPVTNFIGSSAMAFEACRPCPECGVYPDGAIDHQPQAIPAVITADSLFFALHPPTGWATASVITADSLFFASHPLVKNMHNNKIIISNSTQNAPKFRRQRAGTNKMVRMHNRHHVKVRRKIRKAAKKSRKTGKKK